MDLSYLGAPPEQVRALMAALFLEQADASIRMGDVELAPHQVTGVARVHAAFEEFGGALLCDTVGVGKTFIGAAVASRATGALLIAPAALKTMWGEAAARTGRSLEMVTAESLSSRDPPAGDWDVVIVDEAQHFRNPQTRRHRRLARLVRNRKVLLMTATPIHNTRNDLIALAGLFLGRRAERLSETELGRLVIRRDRYQAGVSGNFPDTGATEWLGVVDRPEIPEMILSLPPPVPLCDEGEARALIARGLVRQWASSERALVTAVRRRLAKAGAMQSSLEQGRYPSGEEIKSWITSEDSVQLGFAELLVGESDADCAALLISIRAHSAGLFELLGLLRERSVQDAERASHVRNILATHSGRIVAFSSYGATVRAFFEGLRAEGGIAALTSSGGRVAGGRITRREILEQFSPESFNRLVPRANRIRVLLATDLLSEGVNLQDADVVIHLDLPWTHARLEQRVGRLARLGSRHGKVATYGLRPPASAERLLKNENLLGKKFTISARALGDSGSPAIHYAAMLDDTQTAVPVLHEKIRAILAGWRMSGASPATPRPLVAAVQSGRAGFLALITLDGRYALLCGDEFEVTDALPNVLDSCENAGGEETPIEAHVADEALKKILAWMARERTLAALGLGATRFLEARRRLINRIDTIAGEAPLQSRAQLLPMIEAAREVAKSTHGTAIEAELAALASATGQPDAIAWLERIAALGEARVARSLDNTSASVVLAVLLLRRKPAR